MPYSKAHKAQTRNKILESAFMLFTTQGFDGVTVDVIMENCDLTRGAFYAHFKSKAMLYGESIKFAACNTKLAGSKPTQTSDKKWLQNMLDGYLSITHVNGSKPCPLAFLATDIATSNPEAKRAYAGVYYGMNNAILHYANSYTTCTKNQILSLTAMIIGAVAIARTLDDKEVITNLLTSCRIDAGLILGGI